MTSIVVTSSLTSKIRSIEYLFNSCITAKVENKQILQRWKKAQLHFTNDMQLTLNTGKQGKEETA